MTTTQQSQKPQRQTAEQRRKLRQEYRDLAANIENEAQSLVESSGQNLLDQLKKGNELFKSVVTANDALLDSSILVRTVELAAKKAQKLKLGSVGFEIDIYMAKLKAKLRTSDGDLNLMRISPHTRKACRIIPAIDFMNGPIAILPKERIQRNKVQKLVKDKASIQKPVEITNEPKQEVNETSSNVEQIYMALKAVEPVPFYQFVINPRSFSQTVENLFYVSFLIRDCKVAVSRFEDEGEDGLLLIETAEPPTVDMQQESDGQYQRIQNILQFDMDDWRTLISKYQITGSMIADRKPVATETTESWY